MCMKLRRVGLKITVCPSVRRIQHDYRWMDLDKISYGLCAISVQTRLLISYSQ
jgi:hypothetical protein